MSVENFKLRHFKILVALSDHPKISTVGDLFSLSQPAMSRTLREMEDMAGYTLFERHNRGVRATPEGEILITHARNLLAELRRVELDMAASHAGGIGFVRFGSVMTPAIELVAPTLTLLLDRSPDLQVDVRIGASQDLLAEVQSGALDFALCRPPEGLASQWMQFDPIGSEELSVVCAPDHPLTQKTTVTNSELCEAEWVLQGQGSPVRQVIEDMFAARGADMTGVISTTSILMTLLMVMRSRSLGVFSKAVADVFKTHGLITTLPLAEDIVLTEYGFVSLRGRPLSNAAQLLMQALQAQHTNSA